MRRLAALSRIVGDGIRLRDLSLIYCRVSHKSRSSVLSLTSKIDTSYHGIRTMERNKR